MKEVKPYNSDHGKTEEVEQMFDSIAPAYDFMNKAMSFGLHRKWRDKALDAVQEEVQSAAPLKILDVACGTGDVAFELLNRFPNAQVTGVDLSEGMLKIAEEKKDSLIAQARDRVKFEKGNCLHLDYTDDSFDLVTVAYGVRNFEDLPAGLREMQRVLRPGGRICIIELSEPEKGIAKALYRFYSRCLIPIAGRVVSGDSRAYSYLPESIAAAPQRYDMVKLMQKAGLSDCNWKSLSLGALTYYVGIKG